MSADAVSLCINTMYLVKLTIVILKSLLHHRVIDIRVDLELIQMLRHTMYSPLFAVLILRLHWCSFDPVQPGSLHVDLLQFLLAVRLQDLSRFLKALIRKLLKWDLILCLKRSASSSTADWSERLLAQQFAFQSRCMYEMRLEHLWFCRSRGVDLNGLFFVRRRCRGESAKSTTSSCSAPYALQRPSAVLKRGHILFDVSCDVDEIDRMQVLIFLQSLGDTFFGEAQPPMDDSSILEG